jgi:hypothetical protein
MHQNEIFTDILPDLIVTVAEMNIKEVKEQKGGGAPKLDSTTEPIVLENLKSTCF